ADPDEPFAPHQATTILPGAPLRQHEVELPGVERLEQSAAKPDGQFEIDGAMDSGEFAQHLWQPALHKILRGAKAKSPAQSRPCEIAAGAFVRLEDALGETEHRLAVRRQRDRMGVAHEEPPRRRLFEAADMLADGRF